MPKVNAAEAARLQLAILSILGRTHEVPLSHIARTLGISVEQARKQTMALACCGADHDHLVEIYNDDDENTVVVYGAWPELKEPVRLTASEARALDTALDTAGLAPDDPLRKKLLKASTTPNLNHRELSTLFQTVAKNVSAEVISALALAIEQHHLVRFIHRHAASHEVGEQLVEPHSLAFEKSTWYLQGYSRKAQSLRTYRVDGITQVTDEGPYQDTELAAAAHAPIGDLEGLPLATLEVDRRLIEGDLLGWPGLSVVEPAEGGRLRVTVPYRDYLWLARRCAAWGDGVEVIDPPRLSEAVRGIARRALAEAREVWDGVDRS